MLNVHIHNDRQQRHVRHESGALEFGRQARDGAARVVLDDPHVSRDQLRVAELQDGQVEVENLSGRTPAYLDDGTTVAPGQTRRFALPARLTVGTTLIEIHPGDDTAPPDPWQTVFRPHGQAAVQSQDRLQLADSQAAPLTPARLARWFETVIDVQRAAAGSPEFYDQTARAVVELIGLDHGMVLLRAEGSKCAGQPNEWRVAARCSATSNAEGAFSRTLLKRVVDERRTFYRAAEEADPTRSLLDVEAVVASPVFNAAGEVVGAVYGERRSGQNTARPDIRPLEAQLVQVLAAAVGAGLARVEGEAEAARSRVQFEQFFSSRLAEELQRDPTLLDGRDQLVTILFSDIRGFSGLSERLGPAETCRLVGDVMECITQQVAALDGVIVDYQGDGVMAMWNAPAPQPDHAARACRAALGVLDALPRLNAMWHSAVGQPLMLGIGINTGMARVGNTGSRRRFKYGPLGHTVNLASRVEGATKHLGVPMLITGSTRAELGGEFATRRLCKARLSGMAEPVDLYEFHGAAVDETWRRQAATYEEALAHYEAGRWADACRAIYPLLAGGDASSYDVPSLSIVGRAVECLKCRPERFDPVFDFAQK